MTTGDIKFYELLNKSILNYVKNISKMKGGASEDVKLSMKGGRVSLPIDYFGESRLSKYTEDIQFTDTTENGEWLRQSIPEYAPSANAKPVVPSVADEAVIPSDDAVAMEGGAGTNFPFFNISLNSVALIAKELKITSNTKIDVRQTKAKINTIMNELFHTLQRKAKAKKEGAMVEVSSALLREALGYKKYSILK
ncbi:MAG: hypothetical protein EBZ28_07540 [Alphaproteobacteria bacterium]|nr:hypothetical protein [Alphaproteobacteria bacterium]